MKTKTCSRCKEEKTINCFWKKGKGFQPNCVSCQKAINKERYNGKMRQYHIDRVKTNNKKRTQAFNTWKERLQCCYCGETYSRCLDFHHLDPTQKNKSIGSMCVQFGSATFWKEISKCAVLCKNCHVKVHDGNSVLTEKQINASLAQVGRALGS